MRLPWHPDPVVAAELGKTRDAHELIVKKLLDAEEKMILIDAELTAARAAKAEVTLQPGERVEACPGCGSTQPKYVPYKLESQVLRNGQLVSVATGAVCCCQQCPEVYAIGPNGTFRRHSESLPLGPRPPAPVAEQRRQPGPPMSPPMFKEPPSV